MTFLSDFTIAQLRTVAAFPEFETDRYGVLEVLGRGGMGVVYLAYDQALGREVAIKVSNAMASTALDARLETEARILARLEHPGIVPIHDVGRLADGRLFYVMKRVDGETLLQHLRSDPPRHDRLRLFERICDAVAFAHAHGCIHRDLKPENVMIGAFGEVMVMDWGVGRVAAGSFRLQAEGSAGGFRLQAEGLQADGQSLPPKGGSHQRSNGTGAGTVLGTPGYMAPEQADGEAANADERSDVYSLGAILFVLLTGDAPTFDPRLTELRLGDREKAVPRPLRAICACALSPGPEDRYASVTELGADVGRYLAGQAVGAHPESIAERGVRLARAYRTPLLLVLAYVIMRALVAFASR